MARLFRPYIPLYVRCLVAFRQTEHNQAWALDRILNADSWRRLLDEALIEIAAKHGCAVSDLRLDHDPPLGARQQKQRGKKTYYIPDANDPDHLFYRPHGAEFEGSHDVKTRIRGDHGQYSDIQLIKRERRRQRQQQKPAKDSKFMIKKQKMKSRSAWPPRGSRKIPNRRK